MENREFIAAKDLPVTEVEEVNVLVVDPATGELAQKAGANLGGGGEQADLVIALTMPVLSPRTASNENTSVSIESGSIDAVVEALKSGRPPIVKCKHIYIESNDPDYLIIEGGVYDCSIIIYNTILNINCTISPLMMVRIAMDIEDPEYLSVTAYPLAMTSFEVI